MIVFQKTFSEILQNLKFTNYKNITIFDKGFWIATTSIDYVKNS